LPRGEINEQSIALMRNRGFANVSAAVAALRYRFRKKPIRLSKFGTVKGEWPLTARTGVYQFGPMARAANDKSQSPRAAEVRIGVTCKTAWTNLQPKLQPRPVVHTDVQHPAQHP
jgi:hypothetical protein